MWVRLHPQPDGIGLVLKRRGDRLPATAFVEIHVSSLAGYKLSNKKWLDGDPSFNRLGPAVALLVPDEVADLGDDAQEWQEIGGSSST